MKTFKLLTILSIISLCPMTLKAQENEASECMKNISLFTTFCKQNNYVDALAPWKSAYKDCPQSHRNIYILGVRIVNWQISQTTDEAEKKVLFDKLMKLHDEQIEYFAKTSKVSRAQILARKAQYYLSYFPNGSDVVYPWYKEAVETQKESTGSHVLQQFLTTSAELYTKDNNLAEQFIADYTFTNGILETLIADPNDNNKPKYQEIKNYADALFISSKVADCDKMDELYKDAVETNKNNNDYLVRTMHFFKQLRCTEKETYFKAAQYSYAIDPSAEAALALGNMSFVKENYSKAISFYSDAAELFENNSDKADVYLKIAQCYLKSNNLPKTKEYCKKSLEQNPSQGAPHIILGIIYASAHTISEDPILDKAKYWAAVDQFIKAKSIDSTPEIQEQANKQIAVYKNYFPTQQEVFMHPSLNESKQYNVGSWIGETTTVRSK